MRKSFAELLYLAYCKARTIFTVPFARLIRFPVDIRGKRFIDFGKNLTTGYHCRLETYPLSECKDRVLTFGNNVQINDFVHIAAMQKVEIGNNVLIASKVFISDICHGNYSDGETSNPTEHPKDRALSAKPVVIHDDVWIGELVSVLPGVEIGQGAVIGAGSVVTKSVPPFCIAAGNPARVIKKYDFEKKIWEKMSKTD